MHFSSSCFFCLVYFFFVPFTGTMLTKVTRWQTWTSFFYALMRLLEGKHQSLLFALHKSFDLFSKYFLPWRMILETNGPLIAEKVTSHSMDGAESPLSEQVMQHSFCFVSFTNVCLLFQFTLQKHIACHVDLRFLHLFPILNLLLRALNCCYVTHFR